MLGRGLALQSAFMGRLENRDSALSGKVRPPQGGQQQEPYFKALDLQEDRSHQEALSLLRSGLR
jgi:hypothetical protein